MTREKTIAAIVVAAGKGERAGYSADTRPKQYRLIAGRPVLSRTLAALLDIEQIGLVVPVIHSDHRELYGDLKLSDPRLHEPVLGGDTRQASVLQGLRYLAPLRPDLVLIHDAARPFLDSQVVTGVFRALASFDAAVPALVLTDTIKRSVDGGVVLSTEDRRTLFAAQTPQGFRFPQIFSAHMRAGSVARQFTDDAEIAEWAGLRVAISAGSPNNFKITLPEDFARAERMLGASQMMETRVGSGFDVHPFETGDAVWLCGVKIPHAFKLKGHSDADAALHALADAIYGALGEGDIGTHFPPSDMKWKDAPSKIFVGHAAGLVGERGGRIVNLDLTIICGAPRIGPHVQAMRDAIGVACGVSQKRIAIKATTSEQLGFTGRREGIVAMATATIELPRED